MKKSPGGRGKGANDATVNDSDINHNGIWTYFLQKKVLSYYKGLKETIHCQKINR